MKLKTLIKGTLLAIIAMYESAQDPEKCYQIKKQEEEVV